MGSVNSKPSSFNTQNTSTSIPIPLWVPSQHRIKSSQIATFMYKVNETFHKEFSIYAELYDWSVAEPESFWLTVKFFFTLCFHQEPSSISGKK